MAGLQDLGLSTAEADVYTTLLDRGVSTAKILSREADVPLGRVYQVVDALEEKQVVRVQHDAHPKKITAVEPDVAIDRLVEGHREQAEAEIARVERTADRLRDQFEEQGVVTGEEFMTTAIGADAALDLLLERYAVANDELLLSFREPPAAATVVNDREKRPVDMVRRAAERGVTVRILLSERAVNALPADRPELLADLADHHEVTVRVSEAPNKTVAIVDDVEICLEEHTPTSGELFAVAYLRDARFTREYRDELLKLWEAARPLRVPE